MICDKHNKVQSVPVSHGKLACPSCVEETQQRLARYMEKKS